MWVRLLLLVVVFTACKQNPRQPKYNNVLLEVEYHHRATDTVALDGVEGIYLHKSILRTTWDHRIVADGVKAVKVLKKSPIK